MALAKAKARANKTFIAQASLTIVTYDHKNIFIGQAPGACIIKLITTVIYSFRNKLVFVSKH
jgi:hypothetical protein